MQRHCGGICMPTRTKRPTATRAGTSPAKRLGRYNAKRNLAVSGEPAGGRQAERAGAVSRFVIQKHDATRLHFDFRLEMEGVYRSWAVPKGLPTTPGDRALAVEVEDHPLEYGTFEGNIPAGNYGAGTVMLWDRGHYTVSGVSPEQAYRQGKMHLALMGEKSVGEWTLVRMQARPGEKHTNWLLIKNNSPTHRASLTGAARERSVLSGRAMGEIAAGAAGGATPPPSRSRRTAAAGAKGAKRAARTAPSKKKSTVARAMPPRARDRRGDHGRTAEASPAEFIAPMKALSVDTVPKGKWRLEIKLDGYRAIAVLNGGNVELWSRNHKALTADYPEVVQALQAIPCTNAVIDGEIVALDAAGHSRFQLLQNRGGAERPPIVYYVFDLLHHDGRSLLRVPIEERQIALEVLVGKRSEVVRFSPVFDLAPDKLLREARKQGLEGIIAKQPGSFYEPDRRSGTWLKCKVQGEQEFVIGGFTAPKNSRPHFGAVLVGYYEGDKLIYAGKVGSGFDTERLGSLHREFMKRRIASCPFANLPAPKRPRYGLGMTRAAMKDVTWVKPELVAQVRFTEWTADGSLRHPVFLGLRDDKRAREVGREA
jgi:bifunctional non-homologous end joining protein LigD